MLMAIVVSASLGFIAGRRARRGDEGNRLADADYAEFVDPDYPEWAWHVECFGTTLAICASPEEALATFIQLWEQYPGHGLTIERHTTGTCVGNGA